MAVAEPGGEAAAAQDLAHDPDGVVVGVHPERPLVPHDDGRLGEVTIELDRRPLRRRQHHRLVRPAGSRLPARQGLGQLPLDLLVGDVAHDHENGPVRPVITPVKIHHGVPVESAHRILRALHRAAVEVAGEECFAKRVPRHRVGAVLLGPERRLEGLLRALQFFPRERRRRQRLTHQREAGVQVLLQDVQVQAGLFPVAVGPEMGAHALDESADAHGVPGGGTEGQEPRREVGHAVPAVGIVA